MNWQTAAVSAAAAVLASLITGSLTLRAAWLQREASGRSDVAGALGG